MRNVMKNKLSPFKGCDKALMLIIFLLLLYGSLMVFFAGIALIANVLESLTGSGLVLIIAGLLMLGLVWMLEKQRRALAKSIKENA